MGVSIFLGGFLFEGIITVIVYIFVIFPFVLHLFTGIIGIIYSNNVQKTIVLCVVGIFSIVISLFYSLLQLVAEVPTIMFITLVGFVLSIVYMYDV